MTKAWARPLTKDSLTRQREVEMELFKEREKNLNRNLTSVKMEFACVKVENASLRGSRSNVGDKISALRHDTSSSLKAATESAQQSVMQNAQSVESASFEHSKRLMEQAR